MRKFTADIAIIGSGFAGSLMGLILQRQGRSCVIIDRQKHPRFAIGESSTPLADMVLRDLARLYDLPRLAPLSKYGSWMTSYPHVMRGLKRGFSYFAHLPNQPFVASPEHANELLVAASNDDAGSDTHWLRSDVDSFFAEEARAAGVPLLEETTISRLEQMGDGWELQGEHGDETIHIASKFIIDASGDGKVLARTLGIADEAHKLRTNSRPLFAHFAQQKLWRGMLAERGANLVDHPFDCDQAALHQVMDGAWMWQLRFDSEVVSSGFAIDAAKHPIDDSLSPQQEWDLWMKRYPTLSEQFAAATIVNPPRGLIRGGRMQRALAQSAGENWIMLPHTAGFIDPLHSSGIAHTLFGIQRLAAVLEQHWGRQTLPAELQTCARLSREELTLIDTFVAGCYAGLADFRLFTAMCMFYFAGTITCERRRCHADCQESVVFLNADDAVFRQAVEQGYQALLALLQRGRPSDQEIESFTALVRDLIAPWNSVGLMNPAARNMYHHTAASK